MTTDPGIYSITNTATGKLYIGQATNLHARRLSHLGRLRRHEHRCRHLQSAFDKYGEHVFRFDILEACPRQRLDERERHYISLFGTTDPKKGYNTEPGGSTRPPASGITRQRMQIAQSRRRLRDVACVRDVPDRAWRCNPLST